MKGQNEEDEEGKPVKKLVKAFLKEEAVENDEDDDEEDEEGKPVKKLVKAVL